MRCAWAGNDPLMIAYHDEEWGVPVHEDQRLFEFLVLEGAQAGLSWSTILKKRSAYRAAFDNFDAVKCIPERLPSGRVHLARDAGFAAISGDVVRDRRGLAELGIVLVAVVVDRTTREPVRPPEVRGRGAAGLAGREAEVAGEVSRALVDLPVAQRDVQALEREGALAVRRWFRREAGRRPAVQVVVLEI